MRVTLSMGSTFAAILLIACGGSEPEQAASEPEGENAQTEATASSQQAPACWLRSGVTAEDAADRPSPRDSASIELDAGIAKVCYGAPSARGRDIMGGLVPYDEPWRGGADEATALHLTFPAEVAGVSVDPGSYSLYTIPSEDAWAIVVNRNAERWGIPIDSNVREQDIGSGTVTPEEMDGMTEQMQYRFEQTGDNAAELILEWENTRVRIPVEAQQA